MAGEPALHLFDLKHLESPFELRGLVEQSTCYQLRCCQVFFFQYLPYFIRMLYSYSFVKSAYGKQAL